jgi:methyltransferase (TIGR00027 family)
MLRAAHQILDRPPILDDPLALRIIGDDNAAALRLDPRRFDSLPFSARLRAFVATRSRYAEDELAAAVARGVQYYVVLGAGLDTLAYRSPYPPERLRVFEIDHPATQAWKQDCLRGAGIDVPPTMTFVPVDFDRQSLAEALRDAPFADAPAFFSWLGVTPYLTREAIGETLSYIASRPAGTSVVFDIALSPAALNDAQRAAFVVMARRAASAGEPWRTTFVPEELVGELRASGVAFAEAIGPESLNVRYFAGRPDQLPAETIARLIHARV